MDITAFLRKNTLWACTYPTEPALQPSFNEQLKSGSIKEVKTFSNGVYVSTAITGGESKMPNLRIKGYYIVEHLLQDGWKGESRLKDLHGWGGTEQTGFIQRLISGDEKIDIKPTQPTQFEWLFWQSSAICLDAKDNNIPKSEKMVEVDYLRQEVERISKLWSARSKSATLKDGNRALTKDEKKSKDSVDLQLKWLFKCLDIPSSQQFFLQFNPDQAPSIKTGISFNEMYHKRSHEFDEPTVNPSVDTEDIEEQPELSEERRAVADQILVSLFLWENANSIISEIRNAKIQPGLRTVEPNTILQLPENICKENSLPSHLIYDSSIKGIKDNSGKAANSYRYLKVNSTGTGPSRDEDNSVIVSQAVHKSIRNATSPWLKMPADNEFKAVKARYDSSNQKGNFRAGEQIKLYKYIKEDGTPFVVDRNFHQEVIKLNPEHVSLNTRGKINHLFSKFFVDQIKPHFHQFLPVEREDQIVIKERIQKLLEPHIESAWAEIASMGGSKEQRTSLSSLKLSKWLEHFRIPDVEVSAKTMFVTMTKDHQRAIAGMVDEAATQYALVKYMEHLEGKPTNAPDYDTVYGLRGKYKTWVSRLTEKDSAEHVDTVRQTAREWYTREVGDLSSCVPESHTAEKVLEHFKAQVGVDLRRRMANANIPDEKSLLKLAHHINPLSIQIFYDRRLQTLKADYHLDRPLPTIDLSQRAKIEKDQKWQQILKQNQPPINPNNEPELDLSP